jgi:hypothetical protein
LYNISLTGRSALPVVLLKHFIYLMMDLTKTNGATVDNDVKACFDRIIPALVNLCHGRQLGMTRSACQSACRLVAQCFVLPKKEAGISDQLHSPTDEHPLHGEDRALGGRLQRGLSSAHSSLH